MHYIHIHIRYVKVLLYFYKNAFVKNSFQIFLFCFWLPICSPSILSIENYETRAPFHLNIRSIIWTPFVLKIPLECKKQRLFLQLIDCKMHLAESSVLWFPAF